MTSSWFYLKWSLRLYLLPWCLVTTPDVKFKNDLPCGLDRTPDVKFKTVRTSLGPGDSIVCQVQDCAYFLTAWIQQLMSSLRLFLLHCGLDTAPDIKFKTVRNSLEPGNSIVCQVQDCAYFLTAWIQHLMSCLRLCLLLWGLVTTPEVKFRAVITSLGPGYNNWCRL